MEVPRKYLDNYTSALSQIADQSKASLGRALAAIDYTADPATVRAQTVAAMQQACGAASEMSARTAAAFYDGMRSYITDGTFAAVARSERIPAATEQAVRAFLKKLFEGDSDEFERLCMERIDYEVRRAAGECVKYNVGRDRYGDTRYARVPTGTETCAFCLMLASRGPVYHTPETAGMYDHYHAHCDCRIVPFWGTFEIGPSRRAGATSIEGYDPDALYEQYLDRVNRDPAFRDAMARAADRAHERHSRTGSNGERGGKNRGDGTDWRVQQYAERMYAATTLDELNAIMREARQTLSATDGMTQLRWDRLWDAFTAKLSQIYENS